MGRQSGLSIEQRSEMVLSLLRREEAATKIARRMGISEVTLYRYRDQFLEAGIAAGSARRCRIVRRSGWSASLPRVIV